MGAIPGSREPDPSCTGSGPSGFDPEREELAIKNVHAFSVYCADKLPQHVSVDLRIVTKLAAIAMEARRGETGNTDSTAEGGDSAAIAQNTGEGGLR